MKNLNYQGALEFPCVFPPPIERFAQSTAKSLNCNVDFVYVSILIAASIAIGSKVKTKIKNGWLEGAVLFAMVVGEPGCKKTPAINKGLGPILNLQKSFWESYNQELDENSKGTTPKMKNIITTDTTVEALAELLKNNPHGIGVIKDEAIGFIKGMNQYKKGGDDMEKYLSMWSQTVLVKHRTKKDTLQVNNPFVSFIGGIQVDLLELLSEIKDNGLLDRFLFSFPKAMRHEHSEHELEDDVKNEYESIIKFIYNSQMKSQDRVLSFSPEAKKLWNEWHIGFCNVMNDDSTSYHFNNALSKLEGTTARFAMILEFSHCAELGFDAHQVNVGSLEGAIKLTNYFASNVVKVRGSFGTSSVDKKIDNLVLWLKKQPRGSALSRKVYTNRVAGIKTAQDAYDIFVEMKSRRIGQISMQGGGSDGAQKSYVFTLDSKYFNPNLNPTNNG